MTYEQTSAVVTGASSGIGRAIAVGLAGAGVGRLLIHYCTNLQGAEETAESIRSLGCEPILLAADLSKNADCARLAEESFDQLGTIQTWVNNAGADVLTGAASSLDFDAKLRRLLDVDVAGTIHLSRAVSQRLVNQGSVNQGSVNQGSVNQGSVNQGSATPPSMTFLGWDQAMGGMEGDAGQMFGPVKAAVMAYGASLAQAVAPHVRVNTVAPGWIQTSWGETASGYWSDRAKSQSLMCRWGTPEDVARAVIFAADPENTFLTGQTIEVNGGWNRRH